MDMECCRIYLQVVLNGLKIDLNGSFINTTMKIMYLDIHSLYGYWMLQNLPSGGFKWVKKIS